MLEATTSGPTIPEYVLKAYSQLLPSYGNRRHWKSFKEEELWHELCLCILSSNVPYEMARSAFAHLRKVGLLECASKDGTDPAGTISDELTKPICLPMKKNGSLRKYRFPNVRARQIVDARGFLYLENGGLSSILNSFSSDIEARDYLAAHVPGIGLKEASNFLRNIKYSDSLAIVDTHIMSFLKEISLLPDTGCKVINRRTYAAVENTLRHICSTGGFNLSILDLAIWEYMRSK